MPHHAAGSSLRVYSLYLWIKYGLSTYGFDTWYEIDGGN
jgi:hypothetical protein